jgi:Na+/H+ antiporter NhaC
MSDKKKDNILYSIFVTSPMIAFNCFKTEFKIYSLMIFIAVILFLVAIFTKNDKVDDKNNDDENNKNNKNKSSNKSGYIISGLLIIIVAVLGLYFYIKDIGLKYSQSDQIGKFIGNEEYECLSDFAMRKYRN